jgi:hypothetical protein
MIGEPLPHQGGGGGVLREERPLDRQAADLAKE